MFDQQMCQWNKMFIFGTLKDKNKKAVTVKEVFAYQAEKITGVFSKLLNRDVDVNLLLPKDHSASKEKIPLLILNDGQDMEQLKVKETLETLIRENRIEKIIVAGVVAGDRLQEY